MLSPGWRAQVKTAFFAAVSGDNTVVAAVTGKRIRVFGYTLSSNGTVNAQWKSGASTNISSLKYMLAGTQVQAPTCPDGSYWFHTARGDALVLNLSAAISVGVDVIYAEVDD